MSRRTSLAAAALLALLLPASSAAATEKLKVVATFSILGDLVRNVGAERVELNVLVGANGDAHVYAPTATDGKTIAAAQVVITNGLGFEGWIERLVKASGTRATVVVASKGVRPRRADEDHARAGADPHAWQSVANVKIYVANIRDALVQADAAGKAVYEANAGAYLAKLDAIDREVKEAVAKIPADRRRIITTHDAFGYFKDAYGMDFIAPQGLSTDAEASARDVARIITQIKKQKIP